MTILILAGGKGTRLKPLTITIPKPLIPIKEEPILERLIKTLKEQNFKEIIISTNYKNNLIENYFEKGKKYGIKIKYLNETKELGTATPLKELIKRYKTDKEIIIINGDIITKTNFRKILENHKKTKADITIATKEENIKLKYGTIKSKGNTITKIKEKPTIKKEISIGINIINKNIINLIPNKKYDMPKLINKAIMKNKNVKKYKIKDFWMAIDKPIDLEKANKIKSIK